MERLYVIATIGRNRKEIYLAVDESIIDKIRFKWVDNIELAYATFNPSDVEYTAKHYFTKYNKWYITSYLASFEG